jgi:hypothetical protein
MWLGMDVRIALKGMCLKEVELPKLYMLIIIGSIVDMIKRFDHSHFDDE